MKNKYIILGLAPILALTGCNAVADEFSKSLEKAMLKAPDPTTEPLNYNEAYREFLSKVTTFEAKFTAATLDSMEWYNDNIAISPTSVFLALAMAGESASGQTADEIYNALGLTQNEIRENIQLYCRVLNSKFEEETEKGKYVEYGEVRITDSIWFQKGFSVKDTLLEVLSKYYNSYSFQTDFQKDNKKANELVREFICKETRGLIDKDLELDTSTLAVLLNTLYFKDSWNHFSHDLSFTKDKIEFKNNDKSVKSTQLLQGYSFNGKQYVGEKYRAFYTHTNRNYRLTFIVPNDGYELSDIVNFETYNDSNNRSYQFRDEEKKEEYYTNCLFPEFIASSDIDLNSVLSQQFNVTKMFDPDNAEFSNISEEQQLYVNQVKHVAKFDVNKSGVVGAAITAVIECGSSEPIETYTKVYEEFVVDRAFAFTFSYVDNILFSGIVQKI